MMPYQICRAAFIFFRIWMGSHATSCLKYSKTILGKPARKHQYWFDHDDQDLRRLLDMRDHTHQKTLQARYTISTVAAYKDVCLQLQQHTHSFKTNWWDRKTEELQGVACKNDMNGFYNRLKDIFGPKTKELVQLKSVNDQETFTDIEIVLTRWSYIQQLFNVPGENLKRLEAYTNVTSTPVLTRLSQWKELESNCES